MYRGCSQILLAVVMALHPPVALSDALEERVPLWESKALLCDPGPGAAPFPSKQTNDPAQPCDDGDMTLFNGLLCAAGDQRGCAGVAEAQDPVSGEWFRSPRIRLHGNDRGGASFSPDMALGVELYLLSSKDQARAYKWLMWMDEHVACSLNVLGWCAVRALPRFCTDDAPDGGCTMRHGDAATLAATVDFLQRQAGMPALPDGRLRGHLGTFSGYGPAIAAIDANLNRPGYSQHLVAVSLWVLKAAGTTDPRLAEASQRLSQRAPDNAFFRFLSEGPTLAVRQKVLERCPAAATVLVQPLRQWQWEREEADQAWRSSAYWDCLFMARLLQ